MSPSDQHAPLPGRSISGQVAEWLKALDSKSSVPSKGTVGSTPTLSALPEKSLLSEVTKPERRLADVGKRGNCQRNCQQMG